MRNRLQLLVTPLLLVAQVAHTVPVVATDSTQAPAQVETQNPNVTLNLNSPDLVQATDTAPNFDTEVLAPLRAAQAAKAQADAAAAAARRHRRQRVVTGPVTGDVWYRLRMCESGNNYARNSGNGYFGAYQYNLSTWSNFAGYARPDLAPASVQDEKARETQARRGWAPWPACSRKLGLI
ncbi:MAG TPA: transglycosylase family protein [Candidatus Saccharimonadales bacterium]|nr:transglycosylase family protein [Candidatus Saccharimonadales bacterium]